eukprot:9759-Pyramimonas_sp.AAC.1
MAVGGKTHNHDRQKITNGKVLTEVKRPDSLLAVRIFSPRYPPRLLQRAPTPAEIRHGDRCSTISIYNGCGRTLTTMDVDVPRPRPQLYLQCASDLH